MSFKKLQFTKKDSTELLRESQLLLDKMKKRRSVRRFSDTPVPIETIKNAVRIATSAPSGANKEPWTFVVVRDQKVKKEIRIAAEREEKEFPKYIIYNYNDGCTKTSTVLTASSYFWVN